MNSETLEVPWQELSCHGYKNTQLKKQYLESKVTLCQGVYVQNAEIYATNEAIPQIVRAYLWDPTEPVVTCILSMCLYNADGSWKDTLYYTHDLQKNVTALFGGQVNRRAKYQYDAYGNLTLMEGDAAEENPYRYSSEYHDSDLGLIYYNYRHYNPTDGRWITRDPIAERGGNNLYAFVGNSGGWMGDLLGLLEQEPFPIDKMPDMMKDQKWLNGARLMNIWLHEKCNCDDKTLKMDSWILTYPRAKEAYDELASLSPRVLDQRKVVENIIKVKYDKEQHTHYQKDFSLGAQKLDAYHITYRKIDTHQLDDMGAALGSFALYLLIRGKRCEVNCFCIHQIGIYAKDEYSFNDGDQFLGYWNRSTGFAGITPWSDGEKITNANFRDYKRRTGKGTDFTVYSDIKVTNVDPPVKVCW